MKQKPRINFRSVSDVECDWQRRAIAAAIAAARAVIKDGAIPARTPISFLNDEEWGWLVAAAVFGWVNVRGEQAAAENLDAESLIRSGIDLDPSEDCAVQAVLPKLAELPGIDWTMPFGEWPRENVVRFLLAANRLINAASAPVR